MVFRIPRSVQQVYLQDLKFGVWCALSAQKIIRLYY